MDKPVLNSITIIGLVRDNPVIWDKNNEKYRDKFSTHLAWKVVLTKLFDDWEEFSANHKQHIGKQVIRRWFNIRDSYMKWQKKCTELEKNGEDINVLNKYIYHKELSFLENVVVRRMPKRSKAPSKKKKKDREFEVIIKSEEVTDEEDTNNAETVDDNDSNAEGEALEENALSPSAENEDHPMSNSSFLNVLNRMADRHVMFFHGILPSLKDFTDDETLRFQLQILQFIKNTKDERNFNSNQNMS